MRKEGFRIEIRRTFPFPGLRVLCTLTCNLPGRGKFHARRIWASAQRRDSVVKNSRECSKEQTDQRWVAARIHTEFKPFGALEPPLRGP
jgi:hypothetical protein